MIHDRQSGASNGLPRGVWILGFVSMLMDVSSEMIHSLLPLFMLQVLGAGAFSIGIVEGIAESTALIAKVFSGVLSDRLGSRKLLAVIGYALGAITKPLFAIAPSLTVVMAARFLDRIGKGIRGAPSTFLTGALFSLTAFMILIRHPEKISPI